MTKQHGWWSIFSDNVAARVTLLLVVAIASYVVSMYAVAIIVGVANAYGAGWGATTIGSLSMRCAVYALTILLLVGWLRLGGRSLTMKSIGLDRLMGAQDIGFGAVGFLVYGIVAMLVLYLLSRVPSFDVNQVQNVGVASNYLYGMELWITFAVLVIAVPVAEEIMFRGLLYGRLRQEGLRWWIAAVIISVLFGLAHGQWNVGVDVFILSMVACALREFTGTLWPSILIHITKNFIAFSLLYLVVRP